MPAFYVGGVNACGKTTLVTELARVTPNIHRVHTTSAIIEELGLVPGDYDTLRSLPIETKNSANETMLSRLVMQAATDDHRTPIFDSHFLTMVDGEISRIIDDTAMWPHQLGGFVLVSAERDVILERVWRDSDHRSRRLFPKEASPSTQASLVDRYIGQTQEEFDRLVGHFAVPSLVLENNGSLSEPLSVFQDFIRHNT